jgi:23S rRNA (pseudouridine1915-N3)-methyltransferase
MILRILTVGNKMPDWVQQGFHEYAKRVASPWRLELQEITAEKRGKTSNIAQLKIREGEKILAALKPDSAVIALDVTGQAFSSPELALQLKTLQKDYRYTEFIIGGADGLSTACLEKANLRWSLSPLTYPHALVRIILAEQLYRGISILQQHPYHR